jgi:hypothetical protein
MQVFNLSFLICPLLLTFFYILFAACEFLTFFLLFAPYNLLFFYALYRL